MKCYIVLFGLIVISANVMASSVSLTNDAIYYQGYNISGNSLSFNSDYGKYGYQLSLQQTNSYSETDKNGSLTATNTIDITSISVGLFRTFSTGNFYFRPIVGAVHSTVNLNTRLVYQASLQVGDWKYPVNLQYETYNSKTGILPMYGAYIGYSLNSNISFFYSIKEQGYRLTSLGIEVSF